MAIELAEDNFPTLGSELYARYYDAYLNYLCTVDTWEDLSEMDRVVWEELAQQRVSNLSDTYDLQRDLMARSAQDLPTQVYITPQAIMYFVLNLEELGETSTAMSEAIHGGDLRAVSTGGDVTDAHNFSLVADVLATEGALLQTTAAVLRNLVKCGFGQRLPRIALRLDHAIELADGCVDVAVVNAGLTLSLGLPARVCYDAVVLSNLSKANPETGSIDKQADGKWIKGVNYKQPNLSVIIEPLLWKPE